YAPTLQLLTSVSLPISDLARRILTACFPDHVLMWFFKTGFTAGVSRAIRPQIKQPAFHPSIRAPFPRRLRAAIASFFVHRAKWLQPAPLPGGMGKKYIRKIVQFRALLCSLKRVSV
ncbi:hypothetical protein ACY2I5_005652, partial [Escherichia coli]